MKTKEEVKKSDSQSQSLVLTRTGKNEAVAHGKKPLTQLATLATLSPRERALDVFVSSVGKSAEQTQNVYENKQQVQKVAKSWSVMLGGGFSLLLLDVVPEA